jgi:hypothetical protein
MSPYGTHGFGVRGSGFGVRGSGLGVGLPCSARKHCFVRAQQRLSRRTKRSSTKIYRLGGGERKREREWEMERKRGRERGWGGGQGEGEEEGVGVGGISVCVAQDSGAHSDTSTYLPRLQHMLGSLPTAVVGGSSAGGLGLGLRA